MADHHIDSIPNFDYPAAAKHILQSHGLYISNAPEINHKPGNDFISDWFYPFPTYPDYRFANQYENNNEIKDPGYPEEPDHSHNDFDRYTNFELPGRDLKILQNLSNPIISGPGEDFDNFIDRASGDYTGLVLQCAEKKAYDISYIKPFYRNGELKMKLIVTEIVTGHKISIATFDGRNYHIYRGLVRYISAIKPPMKNGKRIYPINAPFGYKMQESVNLKENLHKLTECNLKIVMDGSVVAGADLFTVSVNQIIDIQPYDHIYDFTIYEGGLKVFWDDWVDAYDSSKLKDTYTYIPGPSTHPQVLYYKVIEHQKIQPAMFVKLDDNLYAARYIKSDGDYFLSILRKYDAHISSNDDILLVHIKSSDEYQMIRPMDWVVIDTETSTLERIIPKGTIPELDGLV